jgi:hypothetical protein
MGTGYFKRVRAYLAVALVLTVALAACADDDADSPAGSGDAPRATVTPPPGNTATETPGLGANQTSGETRDGHHVFRASDAGEVEIRREERRLALVEVRPSSGWTHLVDERDDEIEVDFRNDGREIEIEIELDDGQLEVQVCDTRLDATGDVYTVEEAGEVEVRRDGERLVLVEVRPNDGWTHRVDEDDDDEIEVVFTQDGRTVAFDLEWDDGRLEAKTCTYERY